jgi:serine/threonine protein kinase
MSQTPCPERQQLSAYLLGRIDEATSEILDAHFLQCQQCQTLLAQAHPEEDTFVLELKSDHTQSEFEDEPALRNVIQRISKHDFCKENDTPPQNKPVKLPERKTVLEPSQAMILGPYRLLKVLGKGGMGQVYLAEHMRLEMIVAIKVLADWLTHDRRAIALFDREMKAVGRFNHPNIVRATDAGEFQGQHYLAMEYVDGQDLLHVIQTSGRLKVNDACAVISQAAAGIQHAHENNLIHRDLKPSNLMITKDGVVKVLDLGLARLQANADDGLTSDFQIMGTADYMAPEQALTALEVDSRVDIYSLGCTLYALLCGRPPFADKNHSTTLRKIIAHKQEQPKKANEHRAEIPVALSEIIDKAIARSPADRYASANDLAIALEPFVDGADLAALYKSLSPTSEETEKNTGDIAQHLAMTDILTSVKPKPMAGDLPPNRASRNWWLAAAIMLLTATGLASLILRFNTASGTIIVEIDGDQIQTSLDGERVIIEDKAKGTIYHLSVGDEQAQKQLLPGKYTIRVENKTSGLRLDTHEFEITRDDATVVKAYLQQKAIASSTIPQQPTNPDSTSPRIESTTDSFEEWALAKGAILEIESNGSFNFIQNMESLPKEEFRVLSLDFTKPIDFSKEDFERMGKVNSLRRLGFQDLELTDRVITQLVALSQISLWQFRYDASIPRQLQMLHRLPRL